MSILFYVFIWYTFLVWKFDTKEDVAVVMISETRATENTNELTNRSDDRENLCHTDSVVLRKTTNLLHIFYSLYLLNTHKISIFDGMDCYFLFKIIDLPFNTHF